MKTKHFFHNIIFLHGFILFFLSFKVSGQIKINHWIHQPEKTAFRKPLIYIDFWATWCAPCISAMPHTKALEKKFGHKVLFVYISNEPENKIKSFMSGRNLNFYSANDTAEFNFKHYKIDHLPYSLILNPEGKVIWRGKPGALNEKILEKLIVKYGNHKGKSRRINLKKLDDSNTNADDNLTNGQKFSLKYKKFDFCVPYQRLKQGKRITYQGDLKSILVNMLSVEPYQIDLDNHISYWKIIFEEPFYEKEADVAFSFLKSAGFEWKIIEKEKEIYQLKERDTSSWLNYQLYQYAESPNQSLSMTDDYFLTIDNASPVKLARILSEKTPWIFTYRGDTGQIYDWNIRIDSLENLLKNLIEDLDFKIRKKTEKIPVYIIRHKLKN